MKICSSHIDISSSVQNFAELAKTVAVSWRVVDTDTLSYCQAVAQIIKERHAELTKAARGVLKPKRKKKENKNKNAKKLKEKKRSHSHPYKSIATAVSSSLSMTSFPLVLKISYEEVVATSSVQHKPTCQQRYLVSPTDSKPAIVSACPPNQDEGTSPNILNMMYVGIPSVIDVRNTSIPTLAQTMPSNDWWINDDPEDGNISDIDFFL